MSSLVVFLADVSSGYWRAPWCRTEVVTAPEQVAGYCGDGLYWEILSDSDEGSDLSVAVREVLGSYGTMPSSEAVERLIGTVESLRGELYEGRHV